jgi:hypothetical protein
VLKVWNFEAIRYREREAHEEATTQVRQLNPGSTVIIAKLLGKTTKGSGYVK